MHEVDCDICIENDEEEPNEGTVEFGNGTSGYICQNHYEGEMEARLELIERSYDR